MPILYSYLNTICQVPLYGTAFPPEWWSFGTVPQMDILRNFFTRLGDVLRVTIQLPMVIWILYQIEDRAVHLFALIGMLMIIFSMYSPTNWVGGAGEKFHIIHFNKSFSDYIFSGYTFWTTRPAFYKLHALHSMIFEFCYRETICKNGNIKRLEKGSTRF